MMTSLVQVRKIEMKNCLISYRNVSVGYNETAIVQGISFELTKGEYLAIIGANGTGKSTIIRSIMDGALYPQRQDNNS